jgi:hypothetical protein
MAYDEDIRIVPKNCSTFRLPAEEWSVWQRFKWGECRPILVLTQLAEKEDGVKYAAHDESSLYSRTSDFLEVKRLHGKGFRSIGFAKVVDASKGFSFDDVMDKGERLHRKGRSIDGAQRSRHYALVAKFMRSAWQEAGEHMKMKLYGGCTSTAQVYEFLPSDSNAMSDIQSNFEALGQVGDFRSNAPQLFGDSEEHYLEGYAPTSSRSTVERPLKQPKLGEGDEGKSKKGKDKKRGEKDDDKSKTKIEVGAYGADVKSFSDLSFYVPRHDDDAKGTLFDYPGFAAKAGFDPNEFCGPALMNGSGVFEKRCNNPAHSLGCAEHQKPRVGGKPLKVTPKDLSPFLTSVTGKGENDKLKATAKDGQPVKGLQLFQRPA